MSAIEGEAGEHRARLGRPLVAHRAISLRYGIWSLSGHSGLWQAVRPADLRVRGLADFESNGIPSFQPPVQLARRPLTARLMTSRSQACAGWLSSRRNQIMAASTGLGDRDNRWKTNGTLARWPALLHRPIAANHWQSKKRAQTTRRSGEIS